MMSAAASLCTYCQATVNKLKRFACLIKATYLRKAILYLQSSFLTAVSITTITITRKSLQLSLILRSGVFYSQVPTFLHTRYVVKTFYDNTRILLMSIGPSTHQSKLNYVLSFS